MKEMGSMDGQQLSQSRALFTEPAQSISSLNRVNSPLSTEDVPFSSSVTASDWRGGLLSVIKEIRPEAACLRINDYGWHEAHARRSFFVPRICAMLVLEARDITKSYGSAEARVEALRGVDLQVTKGEWVAIMGPSGSGKSTLLNILGGIEVPTSGQALLESIDLATLTDDQRTLIRRQRIGFIFQSFNLLPTLTAEENVALPLVLDGVKPAEASARAIEKLTQVGVAHRRHHVPSAMSGGEQQRVAIARALAIEPALLMADEPTGNLDSANGAQVIRLLRQLVEERDHTIVMVTHDAEVASLADRIIHVRDGLIESEELVDADHRSSVAAHK
jgi:putative ABC transport system ATP-binding protein